MSWTAEIAREIRPTLRLALPIVGGHVGQILLGVTDSVMIGRVGAVPLAASAFAGALFGFVYVAAIGLLSSVAVRAAFAAGAGEQRRVGEVLRHGLAMALAASLVLGLGLHATTGWLHRFGQPDDVAREAAPYLAIVGWSLVPGLLFLALKQFHEALHRPWVPLGWVLAGVAANIVLNWILIYGNLGAPALGLAGAGWATLLSRIGIAAGLGAHLLCSRALAPMRPAAWRAPLDPREFRHLLALGWPAGVQLAFESGLFSAAAVVMGWLGVVALAAHQIALSCAATTFMFPLGIAQALTVRVGHARGAGRHDLVRSIGFSGIGAGAAIMGGFAVVFIFAGRTLAGLFVDNETVAALAARLLVVAGVFQIFDGTQVTSMGALRGLADVRRPTLITFFGYWVLALPAALGLGLACGFGPVGVWSGLALGLAACAALLLARFAALTAAPRPHGRGRALS